MTSQPSWRRFLAELKRRKVYRVAAVYAATAFVVVQAADLTFKHLMLPPWTVRLVIVLALLGFPLAVVLAWAFEVTPKGVRRDGAAGRERAAGEDQSSDAFSVGTRALVAVAAGFVVLVAGGWWVYGADESFGADVDRLAVLPLSNLMQDPEQAYFVQGMHDRLISELQQAGLPVKARTSVVRYADGGTPAREIARQLDVDALVEGSVFRLGDSVEIEVRLVDPSTEEYLWSESFAGDLRDVVTLHRNLTRSIAREIRAALTPADDARLAEADTVDPRAYDAYLKGVYHSQRFTPEAFDTALDYFERARQIDSTYAPAYVGIARSWQFRAQASRMTGVTVEEAREHIRPALERALELDDDLPEAHLALGWFRAWNEWRFEKGLEALRRAVELNPSNAESRIFYAHLLTIFGRWDEAREHAEAAVEIDPYNPFIQGLYAVYLNMTRRFEEAIDVLEELFRTHPDAGFGWRALVRAYESAGRYEDALDVYRQMWTAEGNLEALTALERGYEEGGYRKGLLRAADVIVARAGAGEWSAIGPTSMYASAGEEETALDWFAQAVRNHNQNLPYIGVTSSLEPLHDQPRFREIVRRIGVPLVTEGVEE